MTTFKNNPKYGELLFTYLDAAFRGDTPLSVPQVLRSFCWRFKGGSLPEASMSTRLTPDVSMSYYPEGTSSQIADEWPEGRNARALADILRRRRDQGKLRSRGVLARLGSYQMLVSGFGVETMPVQVFIGMSSVYRIFAELWTWAKSRRGGRMMLQMEKFVRELTIGASQASKVHLPSANKVRLEMLTMLDVTRFAGLMEAVVDAKALMASMFSAEARNIARFAGLRERELWEHLVGLDQLKDTGLSDQGDETRFVRMNLGPLRFQVSQGVAVWGRSSRRYALAKTDMERLHQMLMSAASALYGTCAQAVVGTQLQKAKVSLTAEVAERNIQRIVDSSQKVPLGDEVLVCKAYRRVYTAHLAVMAGRLCRDEREMLIREAAETAGEGVIDVLGMLHDLRTLDAEGSLNVAKMFKICPAPDVCPAYAMIDRVKQIGNGNIVDPEMIAVFETELKTQILRAHIRSLEKRLPLRQGVGTPSWHREYLKGEFDRVPSSEIDTFLAWEGTAVMPEICPTDPSNWKDSGLGADTEKESRERANLGRKGNMITRLIFDDDCPMPGSQNLNEEHVIKFFVKAEGHKDPARGIFSSNLRDRQAQSWMEKAVESVARHHPSFMIGAEVDAREAKVAQLVEVPRKARMVALYYSFDISGWSAKMPAEPQRISHRIWGDLFGGHLFRRAHELNEGAHIYLNMDGYYGWFRNTHANLEGFNGKEMTMVLVALLSLSVRVWRKRAVDVGMMTESEAESVSALLFAYIDDGLCRIDLPRDRAEVAFSLYKNCVNETFARCGFSVEASKCFPSDRFAIFLNEVYLGGRHVVHGVRAAMAISSEPTERHTSLVERVTSVSTGCRGAVLAGLNPLSGVFLMGYHVFLHLREWVDERDPVLLAVWALMPRSWGGLGLPNVLQLAMSGSGAAFEEGVSTIQGYARVCAAAKKVFVKRCRGELDERSAVSVLTAPLSGKTSEGYMVDSRVPTAVRRGLANLMEEGKLSSYAQRLLKYADTEEFHRYAESVVALGETTVVSEQMFNNLCEAHPHDIFSSFARRMDKSMTVLAIVGKGLFAEMLRLNKREAMDSVDIVRYIVESR